MSVLVGLNSPKKEGKPRNRVAGDLFDDVVLSVVQVFACLCCRYSRDSVCVLRVGEVR